MTLRLVLLVLLAGALVAPASAGAPAPASVVAQARGTEVALFRSPTARHAFRVLHSPISNGAPLVFLVRKRIAGWEQVRLALRPNGSLAWIKDRSVTLGLDPYRVTASLSLHQLTVQRGGRTILRTRIANGKVSLPTPTGVFFITELLRQSSNGAYGPYAFGLSAFSNVLYSFGGGPGQIGLHGTNEPELLGTSASHGCIRVSNAVITQLARILPLGTPVVITQ